MVGMWTPEPPREPCNENLSTVGAGIVVVEQDSTDSEGEDAGYSGYELLSQIPPDQPDSFSDDSDDAGSGGDDPGPSSVETVSSAAAASILENSETAQMGAECKFEEERYTELKEVWSTPSASSIEMGSEQAEQVRAAMANFVLPPSAFPAWATAVPEEQWKQQLLEHIQRLQQQHDIQPQT